MTALPDSIIQNGLFCCWKYEERNGRKTKVPYQPETGLGAKSNDPSSFVPYKTVVQASGYIRLEEPERQSVGRPADVKIIVNPAA